MRSIAMAAVLFLGATGGAGAAMRGYYNRGVASGMVVVESSDLETARRKAADVAAAQGATVTSYNVQSYPGRKQVSMQFQVDKRKGAALVMALSALGTAKSQSYNEQPAVERPDDAQTSPLAAVDKEIASLGATLARTPILMGIIGQYRQGLDQQQQYIAPVPTDTAQVSLTLQEPGMDPYGGTAQKQTPQGKTIPLPWAMVSSLGAAFCASWLGFLTGRLGPLEGWGDLKQRLNLGKKRGGGAIR